MCWFSFIQFSVLKPDYYHEYLSKTILVQWLTNYTHKRKVNKVADCNRRQREVSCMVGRHSFLRLCPTKLAVFFTDLGKAERWVNLRTVPTIVTAHTFCASLDTRISYRLLLSNTGIFLRGLKQSGESRS